MKSATSATARLTKSGVICLLFFSVWSQAQVLEEIVVTAQKRDQKLQDVGISVTAFSGEQMRALGYTNTIDIAVQTPSLLIQQQHPNVTTINIRGISQNDFAAHLEPPVAVYIDDAYVTSMGAAHAQVYDLERVEVLRGPQGTLFGRNATGGLLHYVSHKPTENFEGYGELTYAEYDQIKFEGAISGALSEQLLGRLSVATNKHDGVLENRIGKDVRGAESYSVRGQLQFDPSDELEIRLKTSYSVDDTVGNAFSHQPGAYDLATGLGHPVGPDQVAIYTGLFDPFALIVGPCAGCDPRGFAEPDDDPHTGAFDFPGLFEREIYNVQGNISWQFGDMTLTSISDYYKMNKDYTEDTDSSAVAGIAFVEIEDRDQFSQELRLSGEQDLMRWMVGFYYLDFESDSGGTVALDAGPQATFIPAGPVPFPAFTDPSIPCFTTGPCPPGIPGFTAHFFHREQVESTSWAVFGHVEYDLSEQITLIGALRYTEDDREMDLTIDNTQLGGPLLMLNPDNTLLLDQQFENVSAKAQLNWYPNEDWLLYAGFMRGHKAGNFSAPLFAPMTTGELFHDEEVLHSIEVGAKGVFMDGSVRLNASAFYYDYQDYQASFFVHLTQQISNLDAEVYGAELELVILPSDSLNFLFGISLLDSEVENVGMPDGSVQNRELPNAPSVTFNGLGRYTWPAFGGNIAIQGDFNYVDNYCFTVVCHPTEEENDYIIGNARISYTTSDESWEITAFVNNLSDTEYRVFGGDASFVGSVSSSPGLPRWFGGKIAYSWD